MDVLRYLVRRMESLPAVLVLTYRDEIGADHPLRGLLGLVSRTPRVRRLRLARLSRDAVRRLCASSSMDPEAVYAVTAGNPFLVAEVLASGDPSRVPPSIAAAVVARLSTLDGTSRAAVEVLSVVPSAVERWLVEAVVPGGLTGLDAAERRGVLNVSPSRVSFRHELTRRAVVDSLSAVRRVAANQAVLSALLAQREARGVDVSRIVHHAAEGGDEAVIVQYGPLAQREAVAAGSHREAVAHGRLVLAHRSAFTPSELVEILERHAVECYTVGLGAAAMAAQHDAVALRRTLGDPVALGVALRWLSRISWWAGDRDVAEESGAEAVEVLAAAGHDAGLALALSNRSQLLALAGRSAEAIEVGERAVAMARTLDDAGLLSHALNNVGLAAWDLGRADGRARLDESLRVALDAGETEHACRAYTNIAWHLIDDLQLDEATRLLADAIELADDAEFVGFLRYLHVTAGIVRLSRGEWDEAEREATWGLDASPHTRTPALYVIGRAPARRGDWSGDELTEEAFATAVGLREAQRVGPAGAVLLETAWLRGSGPALSAAAEQVRPWYEEVFRYGSRSVAAELGYWLRLAGHDVPIVAVDHPYAHLAAGRWREAAAAWERARCPFEQALALAASESPDDVMAAVSLADAIGAGALGRLLRERLRSLGVARVPRGPVPSTRENPAGLTNRQIEVLRLLAAGLTNAEIAARLVLSVRTVDTHVAAILDKLGAPTRRDATRRAAELGLLTST
ncbi:MAG: LuxR family transcriptional regulator [Micromonosporaceae bacterium]|nr:LuxR family transcriptional regulator [Micromonosporaceae bacterium]